MQLMWRKIWFYNIGRACAGQPPAGTVPRNPPPAIDLAELSRMPMMNLQPNYFHSAPANAQTARPQILPPAGLKAGWPDWASFRNFAKNSPQIYLNLN
jgi:hypothetical protein